MRPLAKERAAADTDLPAFVEPSDGARIAERSIRLNGGTPDRVRRLQVLKTR